MNSALPESFWHIIDRARSMDGGPKQSANPAMLETVLKGLSTAEVSQFAVSFNEALVALNHWKLWGAGYVLNGGMSDDSFHYFRSWIIGRGQTCFEVALISPDDLGDFFEMGDDPENEELEYSALEVLESKNLEDPRDDLPNPDDEPEGEPWDEDEVYDLYPKLAAKFG